MRFIRGLLLAILMFIIFLFSGLVVVVNQRGLNNPDAGLDLSLAFQESPEWTTILVLSTFGMFIFPIYYWILEPILKKRKSDIA